MWFHNVGKGEGPTASSNGRVKIKANDAVLACIDPDEKAKRAEGGRLWVELCATAGVPAN